MKRSEIRQHIIQTASDLFYENGFNATGINEIISKSGIAKATLYHHFKSKDDVCIAYLKYRHDTFSKSLEDFVYSRPKGKAQLLGVFDFLTTFYSDPSFNGCWCVRTVAEIPRENIEIRDEIQKQKKELQEFLTQVVQDNKPDISKVASKKIANGIYLLYEGAVSESHLHQADWPIKTAKKIGEQLIN
ncbi:MAG: TetR/AcrR family transcriptional regulator [Flavobacteriaceae bacterium]